VWLLAKSSTFPAMATYRVRAAHCRNSSLTRLRFPTWAFFIWSEHANLCRQTSKLPIHADERCGTGKGVPTALPGAGSGMGAGMAIPPHLLTIGRGRGWVRVFHAQ